MQQLDQRPGTAGLACSRLSTRIPTLALALTLAACSGGDRPSDTGSGAGAIPCDGSCQDTATRLELAEVQTIIAQAISEADAQGVGATVAVVDRVGNVLAVYGSNSRDLDVTIEPGTGASGGLNGITFIPAELAAIAKAITGAYLSSEGNAFSSRTASQIVQENFNPGETDQPGGPLFGVQFSQLACSDLAQRFVGGGGVQPGPHRSPLGLSADPGGFPLYKNGTVVGGIGVAADGIYGLDASLFDVDRDLDELIALAGSFGFAAPRDRRGDRITVEGKTLRFSDVDFADLAADPAAAPAFGSLTGGALIAVTGYTENPPAVIAGTAFGQAESGIAPSANPAFTGLDAFELVSAGGTNRYPVTAGSALSAAEVETLLRHALIVANRARAQIRRPLGSSAARVTISVVDTNGGVLGLIRGRDAPVFGTDVSLQKARTAAFFSSSGAAALLTGAPNAEYLSPTGPMVIEDVALADYVSAAQSFLGSATALADGAFAFADRSGGNLSRPFYPDGVSGQPPGPFSKPAGQWSPFSTGLQLDLSYNAIIHHVAFVLGLVGSDVDTSCSGIDGLNQGFDPTGAFPELANGLQIFPGSVPIYRGSQLVGGIGVSVDGIEQDDMIAFLGLHEAAQALGGSINNAPAAMRADRLAPLGVNLRYIQCPQAPFLDSDEEAPCEGL